MTEAAPKPAAPTRWGALASGEPRRILMFIAVGVLNTAVGYGLFALLFLATQSHRMAAILAYAGGIIFNFFSTGRIVFGARSLGALLPFVVGYLVVLGANLVMLEGLVWLGLHALAAQAISLPFLVAASYLINSRIVFRSSCE